MTDRSPVRPTRPAARAARSALVGLVVAACAAFAHALAGGSTPPTAVSAVAVTAAILSWALAGRRLATSQLLGLLLLGQAVLHGLSAGHTSSGAAMLAAHALATAVSLGLVRHGEDTWWRLADLVVCGSQPEVVAVPSPSATGPTVVASWWLHELAWAGGLGGRAPPAAA